MVRRGLEGSGLGAIGLGRKKIETDFKNRVNRKNIGEAEFNYHFAYDHSTDPVTVSIAITITGKAVFEDFRPDDAEQKIEFICNPGSCYTILSELTDSDIYFKIKNFYSDILDNCLGKTTSEQQAYVFRYNKPIPMLTWSSGHIEKSEEYIRNLPESSVKANLEDLAKQIIYGILEYAYHAKDESGVKMHQYARALEKKLIKEPE